MRIAAKLLILSLLGAEGVLAAQPPSLAQQLQVHYEMLRLFYRAAPHASNREAITAELAAAGDELRVVETSDLRTNSQAWLDINLRMRRSEVELMLLAAEPPRWQFWHWRRRMEIERLVRALKEMDRSEGNR